MNKLVSIVIPTRNRFNFLLRAIESARNQNYHNIEIIIIDDGSTDKTINVLQDLIQIDPRIRVIRNEYCIGGSQSRNIGIKISQGYWIAFLDDDDEWVPCKISEQVALLNENENAIACSSNFIRVYPGGYVKKGKASKDKFEQKRYNGNSLGGASVCMASAAALQSIGGFDAGLKSCQDWDLWVRLSKKGELICSSKYLTIYHEHKNTRITNDIISVYRGRLRFHFKHRVEMHAKAYRNSIGYLTYLRNIKKINFDFGSIKYLSLSICLATPYNKILFIRQYFRKFILKRLDL